MPPSTHDKGREREDRCADDLVAAGWRVLARNLRSPLGEIDLLAIDPTVSPPALVAVEVKSQSPDSWVTGEELLRPRQRRRLARALEWQVQQRRWRGDWRLDLAVAVEHESGLRLRWHRDIAVD